MTYAEKCPVCGGIGIVVSEWINSTTSPNAIITCYKCGGRGEG